LRDFRLVIIQYAGIGINMTRTGFTVVDFQTLFVDLAGSSSYDDAIFKGPWPMITQSRAIKKNNAQEFSPCGEAPHEYEKYEQSESWRCYGICT
jgi:hypothetical protein